MFLLPSLAVGIVFAVVLGGRPSRVIDVPLRLTWTIPLGLAVQLVSATGLDGRLPVETRDTLHLASYALLILFSAANVRVLSLLPVLAGLVLNAAAIGANGGRMPLSAAAAEAARIDVDGYSNVSLEAGRLWFLGDVFALPPGVPLANVFSVGDLFIGLGMAAFIVVQSLEPGGERALDPRRLLPPFRIDAYRRLAAGKLVSHLGDWLTLAALVGWIYQETSSTGHVAALLVSRLLPPVLGGGLAAFLVDRLPKQRLIIWVELLRGGAVVLALVGVLTSQTPVVLLALALSGALAALSGAAVPALVPSLLPPDQLPSANAGIGVAKDAAMALGALGAGAALASVGASAALIVDLVSFGVAILLFAGLPAAIAKPSPSAAAPAEADGAPRPESSLRYLLRRRRLVLLVFVFGVATLATGLTNASLPRFLEGELGLGAGGYGFGIAALAGGLVAGEALVGIARVGQDAARWIGAGLVIMASFFVLLAQVAHPPTALLVLAAIGFVDGTTDVLFDTVVQREADPRYYGAVFGSASAFMTATMTGAFAVAPVANEYLDPQLVIGSGGAFLLLAGLITLAGMRRGPADEEPDPPPVPAPVLPARLGVRAAGTDVSVVTWGPLVDSAEAAARALAGEISVEVVSLGDEAAWEESLVLGSVEKTSRVLVLHADNGGRSAGAEIAALIAERGFVHLDAPIRRHCPERGDLLGVLRDLNEF